MNGIGAFIARKRERERETNEMVNATYSKERCIWNLLREVLLEISLVNICHAIESKRFASYAFSIFLSMSFVGRPADDDSLFTILSSY